jgi:hypothetical protein
MTEREQRDPHELEVPAPPAEKVFDEPGSDELLPADVREQVEAELAATREDDAVEEWAAESAEPLEDPDDDPDTEPEPR